MGRAEQTPITEVFADGYQPLKHLLPASRSIADVPHLPNYVLRWWPNAEAFTPPDNPIGSAGFMDGAVPETRREFSGYLGHYERELMYLHDIGANVPRPGVDMINAILPASIVAIDGLAIFTLVRRYPGNVLQPPDTRGLSQVRRYYQYLAERALGGMYLYDIFKAKQHLISPSQTAQPVLVDIEPLLAEPDELLLHHTGGEEMILEKSMRNLMAWARSIHAHDEPEQN